MCRRYTGSGVQHLERPEGTLSILGCASMSGQGHHGRKVRRGAGETVTEVSMVAQNSPGMFFLHCRSSGTGTTGLQHTANME